jgi:hypothetical protein
VLELRPTTRNPMENLDKIASMVLSPSTTLSVAGGGKGDATLFSVGLLRI